MSLSVITPKENFHEEACNDVSPGIHVLKHPLQNTWTWWYLSSEKSDNWLDNLREVYTFSTIEDFWCIFNHIKAPSELKIGYDYYIFKEGMRPMWEDPANKEGGKWFLCVEKKNSKLDDYWLELLLLMIGGKFEENNEEVCGINVNIRQKADKISLWTANASESKKDAIMAIGQTIKDVLQFPSNNRLAYQTHYDPGVKYATQIRPLYRI